VAQQGGGGQGAQLATDAVDDAEATNQNVAVDVDVLANDVDAVGGGLTYVAFTQGANGTVTPNADAKFTLRYTPRLHFNGTDAFTYTIHDAAGTIDIGTVRITVRPVTFAVADVADTPEDTPVDIAVLANDTDGGGGGLDIVAVTQGANGSVAIVLSDTVRYSPDPNYFGPDAFTYTIEDAAGVRMQARVDVTVQSVNDEPTLALDIPFARISRGGLFRVSVTSDDPDDVATVQLFADEDGDFGTVADQYQLGGVLTEQDGATEDVETTIAGIPLGTYTIFGEARDGGAPPVVVAAADRVAFANVGFADLVGGAAFDAGQAVAVFGDGSWIVTGMFSGTAVFGDRQPNQTLLVSRGGTDVFIARYLADGTLDWARQAGGAADDAGTGVAVFPDGSAAVTGTLEGDATFGVGARERTVAIFGGVDSFVSRFNAAGELDWVELMVGADLTASGDTAQGVASFADGSLVVVGSFEDDVAFRLGEPDQVFVHATGRTDVFLARYHADGTLDWAARAGGIGEDRGQGVASFADGSCAIVGHFFADADFGAGRPGRQIITAAGVDDVFVARYRADGALDWVRRDGGAAAESAFGIASFDDGSMVVTGDVFGDATFGAGEANETLLRPVDGPDLFVARYAENGLLEWARSDGGQVSGAGDGGRGIAALPGGACVVTGFFETDATFGAGEPGQTVLRTASASDVFVARYATDGRLDWVAQGGGRDLGRDGDRGLAVASFPDGAVVATGFFDDEGTFGAGDPNGTSLNSGPAPDAFMAIYNADGGF